MLESASELLCVGTEGRRLDVDTGNASFSKTICTRLRTSDERTTSYCEKTELNTDQYGVRRRDSRLAHAQQLDCVTRLLHDKVRGLQS